MTLPKTQRYLLTIDGAAVADLDWRGMWASLLYLRAGLALPERDPYAIPGLEQHRDAAKLGFLSLAARAGPMRRVSRELKALLPERWDARRLSAAIHAAHPAISHLLCRDLALELMAAESRVLVRLLLDLAEKDVPFLPCHDGGLCRARDRDLVKAAMGAASVSELGVELPVVEKSVAAELKEAA